MAKKSRRTRRKQTTNVPNYPSTVDSQAHLTTETATVPASPASRKQVDFRAEYHYVVNDLRTMAILAVGMLGVLVALSFVIR